MPTIWLVRHGEREDFVDRTWFDRPQRAYDDPPLTETGRKQVVKLYSCATNVQAEDAGRLLANEPIAHIFASPYERTMETASIIGQQRDKPMTIKVENGICEVTVLEKTISQTQACLQTLNEFLHSFPPGYQSADELKSKYTLIDTTYAPVCVPASREGLWEDMEDSTMAARVQLTLKL
ncbi:unnamed protein product [Sphagnum balticum]